MSYNVYWEDVEVGQEIPNWVMEDTRLEHWVRYGGVNQEAVGIHIDDEAGIAAGEKGAFGMGNMRFNYLLDSLYDWAGDEAWVKKLGVQFRAINNKHDTLTCVGEITAKRVENGEHLVDLEMHVLNQDGVDTTPAEATVALPSREDMAGLR